MAREIKAMEFEDDLAMQITKKKKESWLRRHITRLRAIMNVNGNQR